MIKEIREQEPFIHFGFNKQNTTVSIGDEVVIWQDKLYTEDYDVIVNATGSSSIVKDINKTILTFDTIGSYTVTLEIEYKEKLIRKESNELNIEVV